MPILDGQFRQFPFNSHEKAFRKEDSMEQIQLFSGKEDGFAALLKDPPVEP